MNGTFGVSSLIMGRERPNPVPDSNTYVVEQAAQALCFLAGANSIFYGEKLLTTGNPDTASDHALFGRLGIRPEPAAPGS